MDWPSPQQLDETIADFAKLGVKVMITELDMNVLPSATQSQAAEVSLNFALQAKLNPYTNGLPDECSRHWRNVTPICSRYSSSTRHGQPRDFLGRDRRGFLAQRLAGQGPHRLSTAFQPRWPAQTGVQCRHPNSRDTFNPEVISSSGCSDFQNTDHTFPPPVTRPAPKFSHSLATC